MNELEIMITQRLTDVQQLREPGVKALTLLVEMLRKHSNTSSTEQVARLLSGLYSGTRSADVSMFRSLDNTNVDAVFTVLRYYRVAECGIQDWGSVGESELRTLIARELA